MAMDSLMRLNVSEVEESFSKVPARQVPSLFQAKRHPQYEALRQEGKEWAERRIAPVLGKAAMEKLRRADCGALAGYLYSNAAGRRAFTLVKFCYWNVVVDDVMDNPLGLGGDAALLQRFCSSFLDAVFGGGSGGCGGGEGGCLSEEEVLCVELAREWLGEMKHEGAETWAPPGLQARISEAVTAYVMAQLPMAELRAAWTEWLDAEHEKKVALPCSLQEMETLWRTSSGAYLVTVLVEYDLGIELNKESLASFSMQQFIDATSDHLDWVNNIFSLPKDMLKQETLNFLVLLHLHLHSTNNTHVSSPRLLQATLEAAWATVARLERSCAELAMRIHTQQPPATLAARNFADATCTLTRASFLWHSMTGRYPHTI